MGCGAADCTEEAANERLVEPNEPRLDEHWLCICLIQTLSSRGETTLNHQTLIPPGRDLGPDDPDYRHFSTLDRKALQGRWSSEVGREIVSAWKTAGFNKSAIQVGKLNGKLDLRGIPLPNENLRCQDLSDCDLFAADLRRADLYNADLRRSYLSESNIEGTTLSWVKVSGTLMDNVKFDRDTNLVGIDLNGINTNFAFHLLAEARDQQRIAELKERHPYFAKLLAAMCDYGRSLWRWSTWTIGTILLFGIVFSAFPWLLHHPDVVTHPSDGLYFSVVTFTTLGYGDLFPACGLAKALVCVEVILGYLMGGLFIAILTKRVLG